MKDELKNAALEMIKTHGLVEVLRVMAWAVEEEALQSLNFYPELMECTKTLRAVTEKVKKYK